MSCPHDVLASRVIGSRILDGRDGSDGRDAVGFVAELEVWCAACGESFAFKGPPVGFSQTEPRVSANARRILLPLMTPTEQVLAGPGHALERGPMVYEAGPPKPRGA